MARKEGLFNPLPAVAPAFFDALRRAVDFKTQLGEALGQFFLLPGFRVNNEPGQRSGIGHADAELASQERVNSTETHRCTRERCDHLIPVQSLGSRFFALFFGFF